MLTGTIEGRLFPTARQLGVAIGKAALSEVADLGGPALRQAMAEAGILSRRGDLTESWKPVSVQREEGGWEIQWGSDAPQADILDTGGTITPTAGKYLAIPMGPAKASGKRPREVEALHLLPQRDGSGGVLLDKQGQLWFILEPFVTIPARPYQERAAEAIADAAAELLEGRVSILMGMPA